MKDYLQNQDLSSISESEYLFEALQANFDITNSTKIHHQSLILLSFLSTVNIQDSIISEISFETPSLNILSTSLTIMNVSFSQTLRGTEDISFMFINSGNLSATNLRHSHSNAQTLTATFSEVEVSNLNFENITDVKELVTIYF